jgi:hypothetical protein
VRIYCFHKHFGTSIPVFQFLPVYTGNYACVLKNGGQIPRLLFQEEAQPSIDLNREFPARPRGKHLLAPCR